MTVPVWMLLGFATWTVILLLATVGVYRWPSAGAYSALISAVVTGKIDVRDAA